MIRKEALNGATESVISSSLGSVQRLANESQWLVLVFSLGALCETGSLSGGRLAALLGSFEALVLPSEQV